MPSEAFIAVLRAGRPEFNAQFAAARRAYPELDAAAFKSFLETCVDPWVQASPAGSAAAVVMAGYEVGLQLVGQRVAGPGAVRPAVDEGLRRVLPAAAALAAADPLRAVAAVANALHQIASVPGARPDDWAAAMQRLAKRAGDLDQLLAAGQVAAWCAGLAHFRQSALAAADRLPEALALAAVGARAAEPWSVVRERLREDPWFVPGADQSAPRVALGAGAFRGFGGLFVEPPRVSVTNGNLLVQSGGDAWLLFADAFGATFHRASAEEVAASHVQRKLPAGLRIEGGSLEWRGRSVRLPIAGTVTSFASAPTSLALTSSLGHAVVLVALGASS